MEHNFAIKVMATLIYWTGNQHLGTKKTFVNEGFNVVYRSNLFCFLGCLFFFLLVRKLCNTMLM